MRVEFGAEPIPVHVPFHTSTAYERALFGAFGSGKTYAICDEAIAWCLEQPGIRGLITRKTVPELRDTTEPVFRERVPHELYAAGEERRSGGHIERFVFPNGSEVLFRSIDDWNKHRSLNVGFIAWDEANEFDEETYLGMSSRVRQRDPTALGKERGATEITRRGMWAATNPAGHDWLYRRFVDPKTKAPNTEYFRSTSFDNPFLPPEYLSSLLDYPEAWVRRYVLAQFDDFAGQIYEDWTWDTHVVDPSEAEGLRMHWMGMDPGTRAPTAGLWVAHDPERRRLIGVAEYQENYTAAHKHAAAWRALESERKLNVRWRVADPSVNTTDRGSNMTLADQYRRLGFQFALGPRQHKDRIPMLAQLIALKRFVVTSQCPQTYEQIKNYKWEDVTPAQRQKGVDPPERPLKRDDHLVDCAQYLSSRWVRPALPEPSPEGDDFSSKAHKMIRRNLARKRHSVNSHDLGTLIV